MSYLLHAVFFRGLSLRRAAGREAEARRCTFRALLVFFSEGQGTLAEESGLVSHGRDAGRAAAEACQRSAGGPAEACWAGGPAGVEPLWAGEPQRARIMPGAA